jgi:hypothetical protein
MWTTVVEEKELFRFRDRRTSRTGRKAVIVNTAVAPSPLTTEDRCDRCGAQAYVRVHLPSGGELMFCAHHGREHEDKIKAVAVNVHDETSKLLDTPAVAAESDH